MAVYISNFSTQEAKVGRLVASLTSLGYIAEACFQNTGREGGRGGRKDKKPTVS